MGNNGLISKIFGWTFHPLNDQSKPVDWFAGLVVILILSYLWATVIRMIE